MSSSVPTLIAYDATGLGGMRPGWRRFTHPHGIVQAHTGAEVRAALMEVDRWTRRGGAAAGFITYEAGPAFDPALAAHPPGPLPLLWFGLYRDITPYDLADAECGAYHLSKLMPSVTPAAYHAAFDHIKEAIARGATYQVNYTWRLTAAFSGDPWALFLALYRAQHPCYGMYGDLGAHVLCSASPELFLTRQGHALTCRPMKGTIGRGRTSVDDLARAERLRGSVKDRAENVMIVDMARNDLGRITDPGAVTVPDLFTIEQYPTVWQMTSRVTARGDVALPDLLAALFPGASITGAPKVSTSHIIRALETTPRGIYTGCMGFIAPGGDLQFNIAIRTAHIDRQAGRLEYGVGSGVTWDSVCADEYDECLKKALVLTTRRPAFALLETLVWRPDTGYFLLEGHLDRAMASARYFGIPLERTAMVEALQAAARSLPPARHRVRCTVNEAGCIHVESTPLPASPIRRRRIALAPEPIDPEDCFLYHKTTRRDVYEHARAARPDADDVLLWNPRGEVTESTIANLVVRVDGRLLTPPVHCGLLTGVYRDYLLARGRIAEGVITRTTLARAQAIFLINSVRGWMPVELLG